MDIPNTAVQYAWAAATGESLAPRVPGSCRICGGPLVGQEDLEEAAGNCLAMIATNKWNDEAVVNDRSGRHVCAACFWATRKEQRYGLLKAPDGSRGGLFLVTGEPSCRVFPATKPGVTQGFEAVCRAVRGRHPFGVALVWPRGVQANRHWLPYLPLNGPGSEPFWAFLVPAGYVVPVSAQRVLELARAGPLAAAPEDLEARLASWLAGLPEKVGKKEEGGEGKDE